MQELDHEACKSFKCSRYADRRRYLNENTFGSMDVDLQPAGFVDGGIQ